jgi:hypothetical protein
MPKEYQGETVPKSKIKKSRTDIIVDKLKIMRDKQLKENKEAKKKNAERLRKMVIRQGKERDAAQERMDHLDWQVRQFTDPNSNQNQWARHVEKKEALRKRLKMEKGPQPSK